ncbi:TPA: pentapeptide repeat-containing protein [Campylobacter jejuni]|uniref:Pentapeptide repeat-containing protein n=1 Tax=Campylobacter jejuni TaxID=197 RepID=A0A624F6G2_CAMJU|nr:pentapeptide repeat-containing protein [Campylobacter jejuni]EAI3414994.1 pentapeptide repeat-containing protein [Campylobacter jejuni]EBH4141912.1 pentapeptide repeat-containing protein [Campylobacter jejuni]ECZ5738511.1 pentapeptide repeat-containing protein [Campylobacter jejuni]EIK2208824.1 pentapeptide repeat-containing protein [Campylobacter jejuni]EKQ1039392.1 pentapeptide repeat-containing protein [Campylobacter jejuni]
MEDLVSNFLSEKNIDSEITFEKYIISKTMLNNEKQYSVKDICRFNANNDNFKRHYDENKILEIHLNNMVFEEDLSFDNVKKLSLIIDDNVKFQRLCIFDCNELSLRINGRVKIIDKISINNCKFKQISINNHIDGNIEFQKCEFNDFNLYGFSNATIKGTFTFDFCEVKEKVNFMNFEFENKVSFKMSKFKDNVYFNNSVFKHYADFHECEFEKIACFYGVRFDKAPNFSACYFKEPKAVNLINVDIDKLDFKSLEQYIKDKYQDETCENKQEITEEQRNNNCKLKCAKHLKDSFRVIKDILITQNNTLEAQEWHKLELYVKEKELEIQLGGDNKDSIRNNRKIKKLQIKKIIIKLIGMFSKFKHLGDIYVKICDFVVCFIMLIGRSIFGFLLSIIEIFCNVIKSICKIIQIILSCIFCIASIDRILKLEYLKFYRKISSLGKTMLDFTLWFDCILLQVYRNTSNHHTNFLKILNFTILMISLYAFMGFVFSKTINFISSFNSVSIIIANYFILFALIMVFFNVKRQLYQQGGILFFGIFGIFIILMMSFLLPVYIPTFCFLVYFASILFFYLLFLCEIKLFVFILRLVAYGCLVVVIILKPQFINPFTGVFLSDKLYESQFEKSLNDLNTSAIINLASILQNDFNLHLKDQNISFTELNSAKALIIANKEKLKEILKVYDDKYESDYKKVLNELENNTSNIKNIIEEIDNKNNNSVVSAQLNKFLKLNFSQEIDILYMIKSNFSISEKLSPEQMALFDQKDSQDKLKSVLALLKFKSSFEGILKIINQDEITENTIKSTGVLYGIILLLCIFSLQKTARKNSIVPS